MLDGPPEDCFRYYHALQKHENYGLLDFDTVFFDIVIEILLRDTLTSYMFIYLPTLRTLNVDRDNNRK